MLWLIFRLICSDGVIFLSRSVRDRSVDAHNYHDYQILFTRGCKKSRDVGHVPDRGVGLRIRF